MPPFFRHLADQSAKRSRGSTREDREGHLIFDEGDFLHLRYKLGKVLGKGTFGKVVLAKDLDNKDREVAIKIVKNNREDFKDAMMEVNIINHLQNVSTHAHKLICNVHESFNYHGHACIVFDRLGLSLYEFMKKNYYQSFFTSDIRKVAYKLCKAVDFCHSEGLAHTDLKPENILFVDSNYERLHSDKYKKGTYRWIMNTDTRLIDFGSAVYKHQHRGVVSTRQYRAPEVIMGLDWSFPCDMFSMGCILFEMYYGEMLFQTHDSLEHLAIMQYILGDIPSAMVEKSASDRGKEFFKGGVLRWSWDSLEGRNVKKRCKPFVSYMREDRHKSLFDLLGCMLALDPHRRITASEALKHPFFTQSET